MQEAESLQLVQRHVETADESIVSRFLSLPPQRIEQLTRDYPEIGPWHDFALVLLHSEAALRVEGGSAWEVHAQAIERLMRQRVWPAVRGSDDREWRAAIQRWLSTLIVAAPGRQWDLRAVASDDPVVQLAWGIREEHYMGPVASGTSTRGYTLDEGPPYVVTPHGRFSMSPAQRAIAFYQNALKLDSSLLEARVRLGWVEGRLGRTDQALAHLAQVIAQADAQTLRDAYLAHLFRGRLMAHHRDVTYQQQSTAEYEAAMRLGPRWPVARLEITRQALLHNARLPQSLEATDVDPWATYPRGAAWWERFDRLRDVRALVAQGMTREKAAQ